LGGGEEEFDVTGVGRYKGELPADLPDDFDLDLESSDVEIDDDDDDSSTDESDSEVEPEIEEVVKPVEPEIEEVVTVEAKPKGMRSSASSSLIAATAASQIIPHHASVANVLNDQIPQTQKQKPKGKNELICEFCSRKCRSLVGLKALMKAHKQIYSLYFFIK
jgi:hypothetical protein